jgi:ankyrin repeat protein
MSTFNLEQARKRAKELLRAARTGDASAVERIGVEEPRLADAQWAIAREAGFASWPRLVAHDEAATATRAERADRLVAAAIDGRRERAEALLAADPSLVEATAWTKLVLGETVDVDPNEPGGPRGWPPLAYVCQSVFRDDPQRAPGVLAAARRLLAAGADPNDGESLYHATEAQGTALVELLVEHGAQPGLAELAHALDYRDDERLIRVLLEAGAPAAGRSATHRGQLWVGATPLHQAVLRGRSSAILRLLVEHGADLAALDGSDRTPFALALRTGRPDLADALAALGADPTAATLDRLLGALARGNEAEARALLDRDPGLLDEVTGGDRETLIEAVRHGNEVATRLLLDLGWPLDVRGELGGTALHFAAWLDFPALARLLIDHGADLEALADTGPNATPLAWAVHAGHAATARVLVEAGARVHAGLLEQADDDVAAVLEG